MDDLLFRMIVLSVPAGAIALLILVGKAIARMVKRPPPGVDPDPSPALPSFSGLYLDVILVILVVLGAISFRFLYAFGSALGVP